jgi:DNA end-binding protein Ku
MPGRAASKRTPEPKPSPRQGGKGRPIWSGTLSFGLISIPVSLAPAVRDSEGRVAFHLLDKRDMQRLRRELYCPVDNKVIEDSDDIARGVQVDGRWVAVTDDELRAAAPKRSTTIEILDFVALEAIDPLYYDHPYLLIPGSAIKPYRLLVEVLGKKHLAGIARFVLHAREHFVALRVLEDQLCLITLRYEDQLRKPEGLEVDAKADSAQVKELVKSFGKLKQAFDPALLEDDTNEKVMALVEKLRLEQAGQKSAAKRTARKAAAKAIDDLSSVLEASVAQARAARSAKISAAKTARKSAAKRPARKTAA